jgi:hypothetical protein
MIQVVRRGRRPPHVQIFENRVSNDQICDRFDAFQDRSKDLVIIDSSLSEATNPESRVMRMVAPSLYASLIVRLNIRAICKVYKIARGGRQNAQS